MNLYHPIQKSLFYFERLYDMQKCTGLGINVYSHDTAYSTVILPHHVYSWDFKNIIFPLKKTKHSFIPNTKITKPEYLQEIDMEFIKCPLLPDFIEVANLHETKISVGEKVSLIGYPQSLGGEELKIIEGTIKEEDEFYIYSKINSEIGFSGGPYINDEGQVIAIHLGGSKNGFKKALKVNAFADLLESFKKLSK